MCVDSLAVDFHNDRIHQERHVVVDEFDDGAGEIKAVLSRDRIEDAQKWRATMKFCAEFEVIERYGRPSAGVA